MFSWWSSLGPEETQRGKKTEGKPAEGERKTEGDHVETSDDAKTTENEKENEQNKASGDSKASELDYAKDMARNVGSK